MQRDEAEAAEVSRSAEAQLSASMRDDLAGHLRHIFDQYRRHKTSIAFQERCLDCLRNYRGQYSATKLHEIKAFGGSDVFARLTAIKCRGASAMLRDVYLSGSRPWDVMPTPKPDLPSDIAANIDQLVSMEVQQLMGAGQEPDPQMVAKRRSDLQQAARDAARKEARAAARDSSRVLEDFLVEGDFYDAFSDFLIDLPIFPIAFLKGPDVKLRRQIEWKDGAAVAVVKPQLVYRRISPFDLYWTPAAHDLAEADIFERLKLRRSDLQSLIGIEGYDEAAIRSALRDYSEGLYEPLDGTDGERATVEGVESPHLNQSGYLDAFEFQGEVPGRYLKEWNGGRALKDIEDFDEDFDYNVQSFVVGRHCIKATVQPNPRLRHNYFGTSFEKLAGSLTGQALPEILEDSQHVANAAFRSLVNNMSIASGPQVAINEDRMSPSMNTDSLYPWKRWRFVSDPMGSTEKPIDFFQPQSNAADLMGVFEKMMNLSDEVSGIPRYLTGQSNVGGAASTASGLNMLMNNAGKVMQQVASQIDFDVLQPLLQALHELVLLTGLAEVGGDDTIRVKGVSLAMAREQDRQRQLEFLQMTMNPMDQEIVGVRGRATILRELSESLGIPIELPSDDELQQKEQQQQQMMQQQMAAQAQGGQSPAPGAADNRPNRGLDNAQRTRSPQAIKRQSQP
jgi:hypothetical protein